LDRLLSDIHACRICEKYLPLGPNPVITVSSDTKILIIGQAPGIKVHKSGIPWNDQSGKNLRKWLDVSDEMFYNSGIFGVMPMGMCYPGKGVRGDLPPRPECAPQWHDKVIRHIHDLQLTLLIGIYAQKYYLQQRGFSTLSENVRNFRDFLPDFFPLVHPSPRNILWQRQNPWFESDVVPELQLTVHQIIDRYL